MTYLVLARKWRPRSFETLVGQEHVVRALTHALTTQRLHHAWLFTGTRGVGKTTLSRILAKSLNCETGITATPCGVCRACTEIDAGRFVDYLELDAASNRGVDEMTQLLEQAVYSPTSGRFKVYMIDEVHMLTGHAFNAMLKTLEEPPPHVKFILATTDPQKIPVTILSRCLQFNLKQMPPESIVGHLDNILRQEQLPFETPALRLIGQAARGSMRDALSLTDQAIAYSAGNLSEEAVRGMLGTIDQRHLVRLLDAAAAGDGTGMVAVADELSVRSLSYAGALADLAVLLSRIGLLQRVPGTVPDDDPLVADIERLAGVLSPDQIQLFYSIAVHSRAELALAPDEYAGFVMACLRMLAFAAEAPDEPATATRPASAPRAAPLRAPAASVSAAAPARAPMAPAARPNAPPQTAAASAPVQAPVTERTADTAAPGAPAAFSVNPAPGISAASAKPAPIAPEVRASEVRAPAASTSPAVRASELPEQDGARIPDAPHAVAMPAAIAPVAQANEPVPAPARAAQSPAAAAQVPAATVPAPAKTPPASAAALQAPAQAPKAPQASERPAPIDTLSEQEAYFNEQEAYFAGSMDVDQDPQRAPSVLAPMAPAVSAPAARSPSRAEAPASAPSRAAPPQARPMPANAPGMQNAGVQNNVAAAAVVPAAAASPVANLSAVADPGTAHGALTLTEPWATVAAGLPLRGIAAQLAQQSEWIGVDGGTIILRVATRTLAEGPGVERLRGVLETHFGQPVRLRFEIGKTSDNTAHALAQSERQARQEAAEQAIMGDPFVRDLLDNFGGQIVPDSIRPAPSESKQGNPS